MRKASPRNWSRSASEPGSDFVPNRSSSDSSGDDGRNPRASSRAATHRMRIAVTAREIRLITSATSRLSRAIAAIATIIASRIPRLATRMRLYGRTRLRPSSANSPIEKNISPGTASAANVNCAPDRFGMSAASGPLGGPVPGMP